MVHVITARNVAEAWPLGLELIDAEGKREDSRNGPVTALQRPCAITYERPLERVLLDPVRDNNMFFSVAEAMWMLAGRNDATWLDQFVGDFSTRYAEEDGTMHGAYGHRWRRHFKFDQLEQCIMLLRKDNTTRQAVIQMWDPGADLGVPNLKDRPCNQQVLLRIRENVLDITVTNRSNDICWGALGANAVHFSYLQEYLAARIGIGVGRYTQFSINLHLYNFARPKCDLPSARQNASRSYPGTEPLVVNPDAFDEELHYALESVRTRTYTNPFFPNVLIPVIEANAARKSKDYGKALVIANSITAPDVRTSCVEWLQRRIMKK